MTEEILHNYVSKCEEKQWKACDLAENLYFYIHAQVRDASWVVDYLGVGVVLSDRVF